MSLNKITFYYNLNGKRTQKTYNLKDKSIEYVTVLYKQIEQLKINSYKAKLVGDDVTSITKFKKA